MVAYNFKKEFAPLVESRQKRQTIRALRKGSRHAFPGDRLQLYVGQRTKAVRKLIDADPVCTGSLPIKMFVYTHGQQEESFDIFVDGQKLTAIEMIELAKADGFSSLSEFFDFFESRMPFEGVLIKW